MSRTTLHGTRSGGDQLGQNQDQGAGAAVEATRVRVTVRHRGTARLSRNGPDLGFAGVGLSISVGLLGPNRMAWLLFAGVLAAAVVTKYVGAGGASALVGLPRREACQLDTLMNCRGVTERVLATIGLEYGLVDQLGFTILVLVAAVTVVTTAATGPLMRLLARPGDEASGRGTAGRATVRRDR